MATNDAEHIYSNLSDDSSTSNYESDEFELLAEVVSTPRAAMPYMFEPTVDVVVAEDERESEASSQ